MLKSIHYLNEQGLRSNIEDSIYPLPGKARLEDNLFIVCDGVGGESKGEEASRIVCQAIPDYFSRNAREEIDTAFLEQAASFAVENLRAYASVYEVASRMSTTLTLCFFQSHNVAIAWCGDSRVYHVRDGKVLWKTTDHSLVMELVKQGEITMEEAKHHPNKNTIIRSLSAAEGNGMIDTQFINDVKPGDYLFLCTDGVLENINEKAIYDILGPENRERNKTKLFLNYCLNKTNDNYSMYLLELNGQGNSPRLESQESRVGGILKGRSVLLFIIGIVIAAGLFLFFGKRQKQQADPPSISTPSETNPVNQPPLPKVNAQHDSSLENLDSVRKHRQDKNAGK